MTLQSVYYRILYDGLDQHTRDIDIRERVIHLKISLYLSGIARLHYAHVLLEYVELVHKAYMLFGRVGVASEKISRPSWRP